MATYQDIITPPKHAEDCSTSHAAIERWQIDGWLMLHYNGPADFGQELVDSHIGDSIHVMHYDAFQDVFDDMIYHGENTPDFDNTAYLEITVTNSIDANGIDLIYGMQHVDRDRTF